MRKVRAVIIWVLVAALVVRILWWTLEPLLPYLLVGFLLVVIIGGVIFRQKRW